MGLLPKRSLNPPKTEAKINCVPAYAKLIQPPYCAATLKSEFPMSSSISFGTTGITIPQPVISMRSVMNMKPTAADFFFFSIAGVKIVFCKVFLIIRFNFLKSKRVKLCIFYNKRLGNSGWKNLQVEKRLDFNSQLKFRVHSGLQPDLSGALFYATKWSEKSGSGRRKKLPQKIRNSFSTKSNVCPKKNIR